jgi:hypothetical protein
MGNAAMKISVVMVIVFLVSPPVFADVYFEDGGNHTIDYTINDDVWVDYGEPGMQTTVNLVDGGSIEYPPGGRLWACEDSRINISGGTITNYMWAYDRSLIHISGGSIGSDDSTGSVFASDSSKIYISGGSIGYALSIGDNSQADISDGWIGTAISTSNNSQVYISGGSVGLDVVAWNSSTVDISGGSIGRYLMPIDSAVITIYGSDFAVDGEPFYGELTSIYGGWWEDEPVRHLTGTLTSGELIDNDFYISYDAKILLTPVPGSFILGSLGLGFAGWKLRRRKEF